MTDSSPSTSMYLIGGAVALASLGLGFWLTSSLRGAPWTESSASLEVAEDAPETWKGASEHTIDVEVDPERGPVWRVGGASIELNPFGSSDVALEWRHRSVSGHHRLTGRGEWRNHPIVVRWRFASGNPQARLTIEVRGVSRAELERPLSATFEFPGGPVTTIDRRLRLRSLSADDSPRTLSAWTPAWMQWRGTEPGLTLTRWTGDGVSFARESSGETHLELHLWHPARHPVVRRCARLWGRSASGPDTEETPSTEKNSSDAALRSDTSPPTTSSESSIRAEATFVFGDSPPIVPWRYPEGRLAALAPVFDRATAHPDQTLHAGAATEAEEWGRRARTLLYGHSDPEDPRFGNGGLLGQGLGGALVSPAEFVDPEIAREIRADVSGTKTDVAVRGRLPEADPPFQTLLLEEPTCDFAEPGASDELAFIADRYLSNPPLPLDLLGARPEIARPLLTAPVGELPSSAVLPRLNGTRQTLVEQALTGKSIRQLVRKRGLFAFSTPLTGSRNPLVPAARESLLSPERRGEWTLSEAIVTALANLSVMREAVPFEVASPASLVDYWRRARRVDVEWAEGGTLRLEAPRGEAISQFTLALASPDHSTEATRAGADPLADVSLRVDGEPPSGRRFTSEHGGHLWTWWKVPGGAEQTIEFEAPGGMPLEPPAPVQWHVR